MRAPEDKQSPVPAHPTSEYRTEPDPSELPTLHPSIAAGLSSSSQSAPPRAGARAGTSFQAGQLVSGRYRIVRFIAAGAMGEVYEAQDIDLRGRVALKTLRSQIAGDQETLERFRREIQLARKVTHPNVCRIFDLGSHLGGAAAPGTNASGPVLFLTMELLEGETLSERLRRTGRMTEREALPLVRQMAAALEAAHEAGVVHRDFKSGNVMLVERRAAIREQGEGTELAARGSQPVASDLRAVVTDFGLARSSELEESGQAALLTGTGAILGTPAYMAPEQVRGEDVTAAADLYAFGVVLYEMVTGALPFSGKTPLQTAAKRLQEVPSSPKSLAPELDAKWETTILRCLERQPAERFETASDVLRGLVGEEVEPVRSQRVGPPAPAGTGERGRRSLAVAMAAMLMLGLGAASIWRFGRASVTAPARRSIAVLGFKNLSERPEAAWLSVALSEMLGTELAAGEKLRTIPGENVARMKQDLALSEAESFGAETLERIRKNLGTDLVVLGSYLALGKESGEIRLDLRLQDTVAGQTLFSVAENGTEAKLSQLVSRAGTQLREKLGVGSLSAVEAQQLRASLPSSPEAARLYAEGLASLRAFDGLAAQELLKKAVAADPGSALAHLALSEALEWNGEDQKESLERAFQLSGSLPREERLQVEGRYRRKTGQTAKAVEIYQALHTFFPDKLEYGLLLAAAQSDDGKHEQALATLAELRKLPPPTGDDPRIDDREMRVLGRTADYEAQQAAARRAAGKAKARGMRFLYIEARVFDGVCSNHLGRTAEAMAAFEEARSISADLGDQVGLAWALLNKAYVFSVRSEHSEALKLMQEALVIYRRSGARSFVAEALGSMGWELLQQGDLDGSRAKFEEALAISNELGDENSVANRVQDLGVVRYLQGDLAGARRLVQESLERLRPLDRRAPMAFAVFYLGEISMAEGDLAEARRRYGEALVAWSKTGRKSFIVQSRLGLATVSLEEGRPTEAERLAKEAAEEIRAMEQLAQQARAHTILAYSLLAQGRLPEAREAIGRATAVAESSGDLDVRLFARIIGARIRAGSAGTEDVAAAIQSLEAALAEATKSGFVHRQFEARLALGQLELATGKRAQGVARLEALQRDASARGFGLIAGKAAAALL